MYIAKMNHEWAEGIMKDSEKMKDWKQSKSHLGETFVDSYNVSCALGEKALSKLKSQNGEDQVETHQKKQNAIYRIYSTPELGSRECSIMRKLNYEYLHKPYHTSPHLSIWEDYEVCLLFKLVCNKNNTKIEQHLLQILWGLKYMHDNKFVHGDLQIANIIINHKNIVKISDFRNAKVKTDSNCKRDLRMLGVLFNFCLMLDHESYRGSLRRNYGFRCVSLRLLYLRLFYGRTSLSDAIKSLAFANPKHYIGLIVNICKKMERHNGYTAKPELYKAINTAKFCNDWVKKVDKDFYKALTNVQPEIRSDLFGLLRLCRNLESHQLAQSLLGYIGDDDGLVKHLFDKMPLLIPFVDDMTRAMVKEDCRIYNDIIDMYTMLSDRYQMPREHQLLTKEQYDEKLLKFAEKSFCSAGYLTNTNTENFY